MYHIFNSFFVRTPRSSFKELKEDTFEAKILNSQFQEAIYIASPVLYTELQKYLAGTIIKTKEKQRIESALYRYISRMCSRCTPFGLFAGCSIGHNIGNKTNIVLRDIHRHTRLDMYFLCVLSQELLEISGIKENIRYYPNSSLYQVGKKFRYVEYQYINSRRIYQISSIDRSVYLDNILKIAVKGVKINEILTYLIDQNIEAIEAVDYIEELICSQVLISELSPSVTGDDFFTRIIYILEKLNINEDMLSSFKEIQEQLHQLYSDQKDYTGLYQSIIQKIKESKIPYKERFLFQVDMTRSVEDVTLGKDIVNEILSTMVFLNKITFGRKNETLSQFQQTFYNRYEDREIALLEALDPEIGIGYPTSKSMVDNTSPLLENFHIPDNKAFRSMFQSNIFLSILFKKTMDALKNDNKEIVFSDDDLKNFNTNWKDLPPTMYSIFKILKSDSDNSLIHLNAFYGICGANLLSRFAYTDENTFQFVKEIAEKEQELMPDVLLAEIAHLPDSRVGNVLSRPHVRDYEILYLANSDLLENKLIYTSDLFLSIRQGKLYLRSKKLNKEIVPRLTNAHNYNKNPMPVYRFLCDIQMQQGRVSLSFNWGYLINELSFLPRVRYKNTILSLATWKIETKELNHLCVIKDNNQLLVEVQKWREKRSLPFKMLLTGGDNDFLVDWENVRSVRALFSLIKKKEIISLTEFLYDPENSVVKDEFGNPYPNECIVAFYKNRKV